MLGEVGEDFAVKLYVGFDESVDEFIVGETVEAGGGADLDLPEPAELAFLFTTTLELVSPGVE